MPAFTAIGAYVATSIFGLAAGSFAAVVVGGIVATGVAMLTSRLINGSPDSNSGQQEQKSLGTRVQLSPSTENKIPVLYGQAYCSGMVVDAYLDNNNDTMTYVMVISETCNVTGATYTVNDIYWNDRRLIFGNSSDPSRATEGWSYVNVVPDPANPGQEDNKDTHFDDHVFVNIYAGSTSSANQIFGKTQNAYDIEFLADHWDNTYKYQGLIFAVVQVDYNSEKGFTGLPQMTFKLTNSVTNPAAVLTDYMTSNRYGANIPYADIDQSQLAAFETFCNESGPYVDIEGTTTTQPRYRINGLIDTNRSVKENIETILLNSGAWMSYDVARGKWRVIPKFALPGTTWSGDYQTGTPTDPSPQWIFDDTNIVSGISISSTRLDNLFNRADIDYYDKYNKDQRGYVKLELPESQRNKNEPDNALRLTLDLTNSNVQAERLANIELKQSRDDLVITFTTGHYGIQAQAGDVISVYNTLYGWCEPAFPNGKYFRVLRTKEAEVNEGSLVNEISAIEYNSDVYSNESIQEFTTSANIGIIPRSSSNNLQAPIVTIGNVNASSGVPSFGLNITIPTAGGPYDELQIWFAEGDDWAGLGGDLTFRGQVNGTTLDVITWNGPNVIRSILDDGVGTEITGTNVISGTRVQNYGAQSSPIFGNGKTGQYTVDTSHSTNTGIRLMTGTVNDAKFTGYISQTTLHVKTLTSGTIQLESLITGLGITNDTVIKAALPTASGDVSTWRVNKSQATGTSGSPIAIVSKKPYPAVSSYKFYKSIYPSPGGNGLFNLTEIRETAITGLPPNAAKKKYFIKCRLGINGEYSEFSDIDEVDLEAPTVYWNPDSQSALNIKQELVKQDFGKFTIPRNGLWMMRTAMQLDAGRLANYNQDYFNMDLGNFDEEAEIASDEEIQDFTYDPND